MPTNINADNGVVSGIPGLKTSADNSGVLALQTNGTTALTVNASQAIGVGSTPSYGTSGQVLTSAGSGASPTWTTVGGGSSQWTTSGSNIYYTTGSVLVGTTSLTFSDSTTAAFAAVSSASLGKVFVGSSSAYSSGNAGGQLLLGKQVSGTTKEFGTIEGSPSDPTSAADGYLAFKTRTSDSATEKMRLDSSGNLLVGVTSGSGRIRMKQSADSHSNTFTIENFGNTNNWTFLIGSDNNLYFGYNGSSKGVFNNSTGSYTAISDQRLKKNISSISYGLESVINLNPVCYNMISESDDEQKHLGFIAQEAENVIPSSVMQFPDGTYGMDKSELIPVLVKAIQELKAEFDAYKASHP